MAAARALVTRRFATATTQAAPAASATRTAQVPSEISRTRDFLRVQVGDTHYDFHWFWLKHNCDNVPLSLHPVTRERMVDSSEISLDVQPHSVELGKEDEPVVKVAWDANKHHVSIYKLSWLQKHAYGVKHAEVKPPSNDETLVTLHYPSYLNTHGKPSQQYFADVEKRLKKHGMIIVREHGTDTEAIIQEFLPPGRDVISTHFGRIEDLRTDNTTNTNTDQLGYTDAPVHLHTDQPFIANPPGMQLLQSIRRADTGGGNFLVDSKQAAMYLRELDPEAYAILTTVPVTFLRKQKNFTSSYETPLIQLDDEGHIKQIRHSYFSMAPHNQAFERMRSFYRAYNAFSSILRDPAHHFTFMLEPGDFVLYDNYRMLHARTGFKGARHVRGVYFNHNDVWTKLALSKTV